MVIRFRSDEDCEHAIDILLDAGESYQPVRKGCVSVADSGAQVLKKKRVRFDTIEPPSSPKTKMSAA